METPVQKWQRLVAEQEMHGKTKKEAVHLLSKRYPLLHSTFLASTQGTQVAARRLGPMPTAAELAAEELGERDGAARFGQLVADIMASGASRKEAVKQAAKRSPRLHHAYLLATNDSPAARNLLEDKFNA